MPTRVSKLYGLMILSVTTVCLIYAQEGQKARFAVSYIAGSTVYIDAGREQHVVVGDTLWIIRDESEIGIIAITAVSRVSSAATIIAQQKPFVIGDRVIGKFNVVQREHQEIPGGKSTSSTTIPQESKVQRATVTTNPENVLSGRVALQYDAVFAEESKFNMNQPAGSVRLNIGNLMGTGMKLAINARSYYNISNRYSIYGGNSGLDSRAYEVSLVKDSPDAPFGYGVGRLSSHYVGGMGTFDGLQFYYHYDEFTAGILGGAQVTDRTLTFSQNGTKGSFFLNYHHVDDIFHQYDGTIAYGRQMVGSNLDRQFLYLQNSYSLGSRLMLYESSEIELNDISNGDRTSALKFSNTFFNLNYRPSEWLSTSAGYDAYRSVYLFETMKSIPDSVIDRSLVQGFRASATFHLPVSMTVSAEARYGSRQGGYRDSHTLGGTLRVYDILGTDIDGSARYTNFVGAFADGDNVSLELDRSFGWSLSAELRYDYNKYNVSLLDQLYRTQTASASLFCRLTSSWFSSLSGDYIYDSTMTSFRFYLELGFRF